METLTLQFEMERQTKNTVRHAKVAQTGQTPPIGTLFVHKWVLGGQPPERLVVTIAAEKRRIETGRPAPRGGRQP